MKQAIVDEITRYRSYEWEWGLIASVIRRKHGLAMSARELAVAYKRIMEEWKSPEGGEIRYSYADFRSR